MNNVPVIRSKSSFLREQACTPQYALSKILFSPFGFLLLLCGLREYLFTLTKSRSRWKSLIWSPTHLLWLVFLIRELPADRFLSRYFHTPQPLNFQLLIQKLSYFHRETTEFALRRCAGWHSCCSSRTNFKSQKLYRKKITFFCEIQASDIAVCLFFNHVYFNFNIFNPLHLQCKCKTKNDVIASNRRIRPCRLLQVFKNWG